MTFRVNTSFLGTGNPELDFQMAMHAKLKTALRKAGKVVVNRAKQLVPAPGYPGDKPEFKPLRDTIGVIVKEGRTLYAVVGPQRPAGAHGHLVEGASENKSVVNVRHHSHGKPTGKILKKQPFIYPAGEQTQSQQKNIIVEALRGD